MSYRIMLNSISCIEYNKIKGMSKNGLIDYLNLKNNEKEEDLYMSYIGRSIGGQINIDKDTLNDEDKKIFFESNELKTYAEDKGNELYIISKDALYKIIEQDRKSILSGYNDLIESINNVKNNTDKKNVLSDLKYKFEIKVMDWEKRNELCASPYNLNKNKLMVDGISNEYNIFTLVDIYRNFDFKNNIIFIQAS